jgi:hypothetical protein
MAFARRVFLIAGIYGLLVVAPLYFSEARIARDDPPAVTHPEFLFGFAGVALAWQLAFLQIARDPVRLRPIMLPGIFEKVAFGGAAVALYAQQRLNALMFIGGLVDLVCAGLFMLAYLATSPARLATVGGDRRRPAG